MKTNLTNGDIFNKWAIINIIDELYLRGFDFKTMIWVVPFRFPLTWQDSNKFIQINKKYEHSPRWEPLKESWDGYTDAAEVRRRLMGTFDKKNILKIRKKNDLKYLTISSVNEELILEYEFQIDKKIRQQNSWKRIQGFEKNNIDMIIAMTNVIKMKLELLSKQERDNGVIFLKIPIAQEFVKLDYLEQIQILKALYRWGIIAELKINNRQAEIFIPQRAMLYEFIDFVKSPQNTPPKEKPHHYGSSSGQPVNKKEEIQVKQRPSDFIITVKDREIWVNNYLIGKPHAVGSNFDFFDYIRSEKPNTKINRDQLPSSFGRASLREQIKSKGFIKILNELGFKGEILKAFFYDRSKDTVTYRGDTITGKDLQKAGIKIPLFLKELDLAHTKYSPE